MQCALCLHVSSHQGHAFCFTGLAFSIIPRRCYGSAPWVHNSLQQMRCICTLNIPAVPYPLLSNSIVIPVPCPEPCSCACFVSGPQSPAGFRGICWSRKLDMRTSKWSGPFDTYLLGETGTFSPRHSSTKHCIDVKIGGGVFPLSVSPLPLTCQLRQNQTRQASPVPSLIPPSRFTFL